jgi:adenylate kinase family enzyme/nucleoside diphosphate kinase
MFALEEKPRTLLLLRPDLVRNQAKTDEVIGKFQFHQFVSGKFAGQDKRLEVKKRKQVCLSADDAEEFFHYLAPEDRSRQVAKHAEGLSEVVVLEHLDGEAIELAPALRGELGSDPDVQGFVESIYCSAGSWESMRDIEFFFPHLNSLPVERTLAVVKPDGLNMGMIQNKTLEQTVEDEVAALGLFVVAKKRQIMAKPDAEVICQDLKGGPDYNSSVSNLVNEAGVVAMCLEGRGAVGKWQLLCGPGNSGAARENAPRSLRARWGTDSTCNAVHASKSIEAADRELAALFPKSTVKVQRTLCIVHPSAMSSLLQIRMEIQEAGFTVLKEKQTTLTEERAKEFYRTYAGTPTFNAMVQEVCSGPCVIMVLCRLEAIAVWKQMMGPVQARYAGAVHGSEDLPSAAYEVRFFFPEMVSDDVPEDNEVKDFLYRKSARASMDLKAISDTDTTDFQVDPTLKELLSKGLVEMCKVQPKGLDAVKWLSSWLAANNPNTKVAAAVPSKTFAPAPRTQQFVEYGVNQDGMPFAVEAPLGQEGKKKKVVDVDVSEEPEDYRLSELTTPPFVTFAVGTDGPSKSMHCAKLSDSFNLVHLNIEDIKKQEVAAETYLGTEIFKYQQTSTEIPDAVILQLLKKIMAKHQDTNRFIIDGFPNNAAQANMFEQGIAEVAFVLYFESAEESDSAVPVVPYYSKIGKVRRVPADTLAEKVYDAAQRYFNCRFVYMMGPPGAPVSAVGDRFEAKYSYSSIDLITLLRNYAASGAKDAAKVKQALAKGKPVDASIACPLILSEIYRDMALGVHNFTLCNFPQSLKQQQFLEHRVPCVSRPLLLDFLRADAEDLVAASVTGKDILEAETRTAAFFGDEMQAMQRSLKGLVKIPCSLAGLDGAGPDKLADAIWEKVCNVVMPGLTIVLGLPGSGTSVLAQRLADVGCTQVVDCDQLLEKEVDRKTEAGIAMQSMLAKGQVVPLSMTLDLLKNVVNLTCSDNLVIENCPSHVDEIEHIGKEFRIDRVFHIAGSKGAVEEWKSAYLKTVKDADARDFDQRMTRLNSIVTNFSRLGKLTRLDVSKALSMAEVQDKLDQATLPQFVVLAGDSAAATGAQAGRVVAALGTGPAVNEKVLKDLFPSDFTSPGVAAYMETLKRYVNMKSASMFVLDQFPASGDHAKAFFDTFGDPKVVVHLECSADQLMNEWKEANEGAEEPEDLGEQLAAQQKKLAEVIDVFKEKCPSSVLKLTKAPPNEEAPEAEQAEAQAFTDQICGRLLPKIYAIVAPAGDTDFSGLVADAINTFKKDGARPSKHTAIDSSALFQKGGHSADIEEALSKAALTGDSVSRKLWCDLYREALGKGSDPMGTFLVTNFPGPGMPIRDQFMMLGDMAILAGIVHVRLSKGAYAKCCSEDPVKAEAYLAFDNSVCTQISDQFGAEKVCVCSVEDSGNPEQAADKIAAQFFAFRDSAEAAPGSGTAAS